MNLAERTGAGLHTHVSTKLLDLEPNLNRAILDIGCGTGALLSRLNSLGYVNLSGLDIAPPRTMPGIAFITGDLDEPHWPVAEGSIDVITAIEVIEHVENTGNFLHQSNRMLVPNGLLFITTPNIHSIEARLRFLLLGKLKQFDDIGDQTHVSPISLFPFSRLASRHGFVLMAHWGFPEDGSSPTSRGTLRLLAGLIKCLGARGRPAGDQLCLVLRKSRAAAPPEPKHDMLTRHYD